MSVWNVARSSRSANPYSVWPSSRMWWWTWRNTVVVGSSSGSVRGGDDDDVADAADLEQHRAVEPALEHLAAQRPDHAAALAARRAVRRRRGRASAPSPGGTGPARRRRRRRPAGAGRSRRRRAWTIFCTCSLAAPPQPATASFTWLGRVLGDVAAGGGGLGQGQPAGLADAHRRAHVDLEEDVLDGDGVGSVLGDQRRQLAAQRGQALRQRRRSAGVRMTPRATAVASAGAAPVDDGVAAAGQPGIDAEARASAEPSANTGSQASRRRRGPPRRIAALGDAAATTTLEDSRPARSPGGRSARRSPGGRSGRRRRRRR